MSSGPLNTLIDLSNEARNKAGQRLAGERSSQQQLSLQFETLRRYRDEYTQRLQQSMDQGIDLSTLQDYQHFLSSLDRALAHAEEGLQRQQGKVSACRQQWQQEQHRLTSYQTLDSRRNARQRQDAQRLEGRQHDEVSNNLYLRDRQQRASSDQDSQEMP